MSTIDILFAGSEDVTKLERIEVSYEKLDQLFINRKQFPIQLAYAIRFDLFCAICNCN